MKNTRGVNACTEMKRLTVKKVKLVNIYLDPNNPRIETPGKLRVSDDRIVEDEIQKDCMEQIYKQGITDLKESIKNSGFWTVDRIVLRPLTDKKYVVVEGNRRVTALKLLLREHLNGKINLSSEILKGIKSFEALLYLGRNVDIAWIIQGFRHSPGSKGWDKYPIAKFISSFEKDNNLSIKDIASLLGMTRGDVTLLIRSYHAFEQAKSNEEHGDKVDPKKFGLFDEIVFKKPQLQSWLGWDDKNRVFSKEDNFLKFLSWTTAKENEEPKLNISKYTRDVLTYITKDENKAILNRFEDDIVKDTFDLEEYFENIYNDKKKKEPVDLSEIVDALRSTVKIIETLPIPKLKLGNTQSAINQKKEIVELLKSLEASIKIQIKSIGK